MKTRCMVQVCFAVAAAVMAAHAAPVQQAYPINASQAVAALSAQGIAIPAGQISMAANVVANQPHPVLEVLATGPVAPAETSHSSSGSRFWVKLGCQVAGACLPFYALVVLPAVDVSPWINSLRGIARAGGAGMKPDGGFTVQAGTRATLILEGGQSRIEMPVIALERGMTGSSIRVATPDHKNSYRATVAGPGVLKGSL